MPDKRRHRGKHPEDELLFGPDQVPALRAAVTELSWLLSRDYAADSALKLVGDRHQLAARQRAALRRSACSDEAARRRATSLLAFNAARGLPLAVDGYNVLISIETAISGGVMIIGRDGCYRDLASLHGTYRRIEETRPALDRILDALAEIGPSRVDWLLDRPVSNSGRLRALITDVAARRNAEGFSVTDLTVRLVDSPDRELVSFDGVVATADSAVLDRCARWINLASDIIEREIPNSFRVDFRSAGPTG